MLKILIIEDDALAVKIWKIRIQHFYSDFELRTLSNVDHFAKDPQKLNTFIDAFDLVITDVFLAGDMTGIDFVSSLNENNQMKTVVTSTISGRKFEDFKSKWKLKCQFISKPIDENFLKQVLMNLTENHLNKDNMKSKISGVRKAINASKKELPIVLITGGCSGVGLALFHKLRKMNKYKLVIADLEFPLQRLMSDIGEDDKIMYVAMDLSSSDMIQVGLNKIYEKWGHVDILVNNAGICYRAVTEQMDDYSEMRQLRVNYLGPMQLIRSVVSGMREKGRGKIINVSSVSGRVGMPTMSSYSASKHALEGASESLWYELQPLGINISVVRPGFINSDGVDHVLTSKKAQQAQDLSGPYQELYDFMKPFVSRLMKLSFQTSNDVADQIIYVIRKQNPPLWVNATYDAHVFSALKWMLPKNIFHIIMNFMYGKILNWAAKYSKADKHRLRA